MVSVKDKKAAEEVMEQLGIAEEELWKLVKAAAMLQMSKETKTVMKDVYEMGTTDGEKKFIEIAFVAGYTAKINEDNKAKELEMKNKLRALLKFCKENSL